MGQVDWISAHSSAGQGYGSLYYSFIGNNMTSAYQSADAPSNITIDASRSSSVYTNNGKVYPASIALNFIIKA